MGTSLRITSAVIFFVGIHLGIQMAIPRIADSTGLFNSSAAEACSTETGACVLESQNYSEPPNFGAPDSQHGSGTR